MSDIAVNSRMLGLKNVNVHVEDYGGNGRPVVLIHGWPLSGESWSLQIEALQNAGYRVVTYDRRGFGLSDKPTSGYDYDTLSEDLSGLIEELDLNNVTLVGFSMGGGEVARYIAKHGENRLHSVVFAAAIPPFLMKSSDNSDGPLTESLASEMASGLEKDDTAFYEQFVDQFYSADADGNVLVASEQRDDALRVAAQADKQAALAAMNSFATTDFRQDLTKVTVPALIIHGDADGIVPFEGSGKRTHDAIVGSELHVIAGGPHGINVSNAEEFNETLLAFLLK